MDSHVEQRHVIRFYVRRGVGAIETYRELQEVYGADTLNRRTVLRWHQAFQQGRESAELLPHEGRPNKIRTPRNVNAVATQVRADPHVSVRQLAVAMDTGRSTVHRILRHDLHMRQVSCTWMPRTLTPEQMQMRVNACRELLARLHEPDLIEKVVTGGETWVSHYDPPLKQETQPAELKRKMKPLKSNLKVMASVFFDHKGMVYNTFLPPSQTVNCAYYVSVLRKVRHAVGRKRLDNRDQWLLHDGSPHTTAKETTQFLEDQGIQRLPYPPYSPDLAPSDFWLFPLLKKQLRGQRFTTCAEIQDAVTSAIEAIPAAEFDTAIRVKWVERLQQCINHEGRYFEKERGATEEADEETDESEHE